MADPIALFWSDDVTVAAPSARGKTALVATLRGRPADADPAAVGRWLKAELSARGLGGRDAAVVLPRSAAVVRRLTVPNVPEEELPDLVRLQAATKVATPLDKLRIDYVPVPGGGAAGRDVLFASVPAESCDTLAATLKAAGLEPAGVGLSPFATAALVGERAAGSALIVAVVGRSAEITVLRDGGVSFTHEAELHGDDPEDRRWLLGEITRSVIAADHQSADRRLDRVFLIGHEAVVGPLADPLRDRYETTPELIVDAGKLGIPVESGDASPAEAAAALGQAMSGGLPRLDFLNPRKRVEKPDRRRLRAAVAAGGLGLVVAGAFGWSFFARSTIAGDIAVLEESDRGLDRQIKAGQPLVTSAAAVDGWLGTRTDWADEFAKLGGSLPGTDRAYLTDLTLEPGAKDSGGHVRATGLAKTRGDAEALADTLSGSGYRVSPRPIVQVNRDPEYPIRFELDLLLPKPTPPAVAAAGKAIKPASPAPTPAG